jgi:hypothetical protein
LIIFKQFFRASLGLSNGAIPDESWIGRYPNSYALPIDYCYRCWLDGARHFFELPEGANRPEKKQYGNVFGCGLVLDPDNKLAIFFTLNGQLLGKEAGGFQDLQKKFYIYLHMLRCPIFNIDQHIIFN